MSSIMSLASILNSSLSPMCAPSSTSIAAPVESRAWT